MEDIVIVASANDDMALAEFAIGLLKGKGRAAAVRGTNGGWRTSIRQAAKVLQVRRLQQTDYTRATRSGIDCASVRTVFL